MFTAVTDDGINLKVKRYRPSTSAQFNSNGQPVLLFPGIVANMNQFMMYTPEGRKSDYKNMKLPEPLAEWAKGDPYIAEDPMLYYSIAHYLWLQGYDPWFANYRGVGRGDCKSEKGSVYTNLDVWAALDVPACVRLVRSATGKALVIGGHSTGGRVCHNFMQGIYIDASEMGGDYIPHVKADPEIAKQRNRDVRGLLLLDPGGIPPLPKMIDYYAIWKITGYPIYLDFDGIMVNIVNPLLGHTLLGGEAIEAIFGIVDYLHLIYASYPDWLYSKELDLFGFLDIWVPENTDVHVADYFARYCVSSTYLRALTEFGDNSLHNAMREDWRNGPENRYLVEGPEPDRGNDGYYYYDDDANMARITSPAFSIFSDRGALVDAREIIRDVYGKKTPHRLDEWHQIPGTAHADVVCGYATSCVAYPLIGKWLAALNAQKPEDAGADEVEDNSTGSGGTAADNSGNDTGNYLAPLLSSIAASGAGCGSAANASTTGGTVSASSWLELAIMGAAVLGVIQLGRRRRTRR
ncbi:MAG TPA: hypothetical protein PLM53_14895 [Spirochaetota bacterium]|nr:hypothetical protein [Spirochaetota bacterium]HPC42028.1 hypothetical protein [Spirochaetota bacterium]HPL17887.1 hypothetical protein [Spirochaetota bacterium]HQF09545.1 hypothetical protein [Spirochaetota bacterium]HQH98385.1 hypothetical protein [Spirochaetota bacterium]